MDTPFYLEGRIQMRYSTGAPRDYSANAFAVPIATYVLLATVPADINRNNVEVQNQSMGSIQIVRDDGNGGNPSSIMIAGGMSATVSGGTWKSNVFRGRLRIYGPSGAAVSAYTD